MQPQKLLIINKTKKIITCLTTRYDKLQIWLERWRAINVFAIKMEDERKFGEYYTLLYFILFYERKLSLLIIDVIALL